MKNLHQSTATVGQVVKDLGLIVAKNPNSLLEYCNDDGNDMFVEGVKLRKDIAIMETTGERNRAATVEDLLAILQMLNVSVEIVLQDGWELLKYRRLGELLKPVLVRESNGRRFAIAVFNFLRDNDLLNCLEPFIRTQKNGNPRKALSKDGYFCVRSILCDNSTPPPISSHGPFIIGGKTYYLWLSAEWSGREKLRDIIVRLTSL